MSSRGRPKHPDILTPREWEVLGHVREGRSNEEIAGRLGISIDGVKYHVSEILSKLALDNRHDAARWAEGKSPRPWPAGALAPLFFWRRIGTSWVPGWLSPVIAGGTLLVIAAGLGVLIWGLLATRGGEEAQESLSIIEAAAPSPTSTFAPSTPELPTPLDQPQPTSTPQPTLALQTPETLASPCPISDETFCLFATDIEIALAIGDISAIQANFMESSSVCPNIDGRCIGEPDGTVVDSGYLVIPDFKSLDIFKSAQELRATLAELAQVDREVADEYGDGTWKLHAVVANSETDMLLVTTTFGPDPVIDDPSSARRVFLLSALLQNDGWKIQYLQTIQGRVDLLLGYDSDGEIDNWLPWGRE